MSLKETLCKFDDAVLVELFEVAQFALNHSGTSKRVAKDLCKPLARVHALARVAVEVSVNPDYLPDVATENQLDALQAELTTSFPERYQSFAGQTKTFVSPSKGGTFATGAEGGVATIDPPPPAGCLVGVGINRE